MSSELVYSTSSACIWCFGDEGWEPFDSDDADQNLCRTHVAEYEGVSVAELNRAEHAVHADMTDLGYFD